PGPREPAPVTMASLPARRPLIRDLPPPPNPPSSTEEELTTLSPLDPPGHRGEGDSGPAAERRHGRQLIRFSRPFHSRSRRTNFWIFPVDVLGRSPNATAAGALKWAMRWRQNSMSSGSLAVWPGFKVTNAFGRSPHFSSGTATTAHSITAGC